MHLLDYSIKVILYALRKQNKLWLDYDSLVLVVWDPAHNISEVWLYFQSSFFFWHTLKMCSYKSPVMTAINSFSLYKHVPLPQWDMGYFFPFCGNWAGSVFALTSRTQRVMFWDFWEDQALRGLTVSTSFISEHWILEHSLLESNHHAVGSQALWKSHMKENQINCQPCGWTVLDIMAFR